MKLCVLEMLQKRVDRAWISGIAEVSRSTMNRWQVQGPRFRSRRQSPNKLNIAERQNILDLLHGEEFVEDTPYQVVSKLMDRGEYLCSIRSMYRILDDAKELKERRNQRRHPTYVKPVISATRPNQLWSWDITRLAGAVKGQHYYLYVMIDVFSRYVVGWMISHEENSDRAQHFIRETVRSQQIDETNELTIHSDRGSPMTARNTIELLAVLGLAQSFSRPRVSDDNPFSEAQFKTLKYHRFFKPFYESIDDAKKIMTEFFKWYNKEHRHINLGLMTPEMVHQGKVDDVVEKRSMVLREAYRRHPGRFSKQGPRLVVPQKEVGINIPVKRQSISVF